MYSWYPINPNDEGISGFLTVIEELIQMYPRLVWAFILTIRIKPIDMAQISYKTLSSL